MDSASNDIGYCLSTVLKDYSVVMDADICLILCCPLWLGLNVSVKQAYFPIQRNEISYINPLFVESFSVNANCLFIPSRANSIDNFEYLKYRYNNRKKTLVKVAESILSETDNNEKASIHRSILAVIDSISGDTATTVDNTMIVLNFSAENQITILAKDFMKHWYSETRNHINTDLFRVIPSKNTLSEELISIKIKSALEKQNLHLKANYGSLLTGNAVLEFLKNGIEEKIEGYELPIQHQQIWKNKQGIIKIKRDYAKALDKLNFMEKWNQILDVKESILKTIEVWNLFFETINDPSFSEKTLLQHYNALIEVENECINNFNKAV